MPRCVGLSPDHGAAATALVPPDSLPPGGRRWASKRFGDLHRAADVVDVPSCQQSEVLRLLFATLRQFDAILRCRGACVGTVPRVPEDVASLKIRAVGCLLEHEILRK